MDSFKEELTALINKYSLENASDTPDYILAEYMIRQLKLFENIIIEKNNRDTIAVSNVIE